MGLFMRGYLRRGWGRGGFCFKGGGLFSGGEGDRRLDGGRRYRFLHFTAGLVLLMAAERERGME